MSVHELTEELAVLDLGGEEGPEAIRRAYLEMKDLYGDCSLATYSLFDEDERKERLERIESAYRRIREKGLLAKKAAPADAPKPCLEACSAPAPDYEKHPGYFLKETRERKSISIRQIADRTKIGVRKLEHIENEKFDQLPAQVFLRGFVMQFAVAVGITNPEEVTKSYLHKYRASVEE